MNRRTTREEFQTLAARLLAAHQFQLMYPPRHPRVARSMADAHAGLEDRLRAAGRIRIALTGDELVLGALQVPVEGEVLGGFAAMLRAAGIERLEFEPGLRRAEVKSFLRLLGRDRAELEAAGGIEQGLADAAITNIRVGRVSLETDSVRSPEALFRAWEAYGLGIGVVRTIHREARRHGRVGDVSEVREYARSLVDMALTETRSLLAMQSLKHHDEYSFTHSLNVAILTVMLAGRLPFAADDLHQIGVAALLHDVGKELVPIEVLDKPSKLDDVEWEIMNRHGRDGARMLADVEDVGDLAPVVAYEHHVVYHDDLQPHPGWKAHLVSEIVCLADVYDALRSKRPYRGEVPPDQAMEIMHRDIGRKFDADLFEVFSGMVGYFPPGTGVRLSGGGLAIVHGVNPGAPRAPRVLRLRDRDGAALDPPEPLDLSEASESIVAVVDEEELGVDPIQYL